MLNPRAAAAAPFAIAGTLAIIVGGALAAAIAYHPTEHLVWMVAFLVLVTGVMQWIFGAGQAWLAAEPPPAGRNWGQWVVFNLGNVGVMAGTLCNSTGAVAVATLLFVIATAWFLVGVRRPRRHALGVAYRVVVALALLSAGIGIVISAFSNGWV